MIKSLWPAVIWAFVILVLSILPSKDISSISLLNFEHLDKIAHLFVYFVLVFLLIWGFKKQYKYIGFRYYGVPIAFAIALSYGLLLEVIQTLFFSYRTGDLLDFVANTIGSLLGSICYIIVKGKKKVNFR
jgi:VanZ family protein